MAHRKYRLERHPLVLETLEAVIGDSQGRTNKITQARADWIVRLRRAAPDLDPTIAFHLAAAYIRRKEQNESTEDLDGFLAFAPWRDDEATKRYIEFAQAGWLPRSPKADEWSTWLLVARQDLMKNLMGDRSFDDFVRDMRNERKETN